MSIITIGVDEAGRGAWAGPVVAWAFAILKSRFLKTEIHSRIGDSKLLSKRQRNLVFQGLRDAMGRGEVVFHVSAVGPETVDAVGIKEANRLAMESAISEVLKKLESLGSGDNSKKEILVDGNDHYRFRLAEYETRGEIEIAEHIRGDGRFKVIGAASILAKVTRDTLMESLVSAYPEYGFEKHKWYGTALHRNALAEFGVLEIHRKSYFPIKYLILRAKKI